MLILELSELSGETVRVVKYCYSLVTLVRITTSRDDWNLIAQGKLSLVVINSVPLSPEQNVGEANKIHRNPVNFVQIQ